MARHQVVEAADRDHGLSLILLVEEPSEGERVVDEDQAAGADDPQALLQVVRVVDLVGVEEGRVGALVREAREDLAPGPPVDLDPSGYVGARDPGLGEVGVSRGELNCPHATVSGERARHRDRGVARERPDLDHLARASRAQEGLDERALLGRDGDLRDPRALGLALELGQEGVLLRRARGDVVVVILREAGRDLGHGDSGRCGRRAGCWSV